ncbi:hypothetical protein NBRC10513v2_001362 [Rhodotorula toruloides]|uniref:BY PROTMAP: gi/472580434/gb/EMS18234.1/ Homeodomain-like containing protein [Rhodosporidium toruloides NP11] gi/647395147/emb/CDR36351.1/ RHTO0S02e00826g1_1 [Rhodosporidium toruloides] n=1 Tax=Rhodotorula toruloides TaxID=5286 RepID=A0A0K3C4K6_RHOTO|nr:hypothetical protein AAT19DRAFT_8848 [Rhodotorula toruloides]
MDDSTGHTQAMQAATDSMDAQSNSSHGASPPAPAQPARSTSPSAPRPFVNGLPAATTASRRAIPAWMSKEKLVEIKDDLAQAQESVVDISIAKSLVDHGLAAYDVLAETEERYESQLSTASSLRTHLESELAALPTFYASRAQLDTDRLVTENEQLRVQARALARKMVQGRERGREGDGEGEGEEMQEDTEVEEEEGEGAPDDKVKRKEDVERENRALKSDVRFLQEKLKISQAQTNRLEHELRSIRSHLLHGTPLVIVDHEVGLPSPPTDVSAAESPAEVPAVVAESALPALPRTLDFPGPAAASTSAAAQPTPKATAKKPLPKLDAPKARPAVLGDAEAELLLHAGKTFSHVRRINRVPLSSAIARRASEIVDVAAEYQVEDDGAEQEQMKGEPFDEDLYATPYAGVSSRYAVGSVRWDTLPPIPSTSRHPAGDGFDGLLQLAEASSQEDVTGGAPRPLKRRRAASNAQDDDEWVGDDDYAPGPSSRRATVTGGNDDPDYLPSPPSAAQGASSSSAKGKGRALGQRLSALDVLVQASASQEAADGSEGAGRSAHPPLVVSSNKKKGVGGKGAAGGENKNDSKKARSPYIKWNLAEDEMLLKAVIQCGCAWDNVAKLCPTRAYHQVRQRFLRGLKSGETLPPELMHLQPAVLKSVADYEAKKKRKKAAKQAAQEFERREAERLAAAE